MMMIIIGNALARAFGIAGAGAFAVAGLGTAFPCIALVVLDHMSAQKTREQADV